MHFHRYLHYDVFTDCPLAGNQLAVFPEAEGIAAATMQRIANEMNFSETTFVLPPGSDCTDLDLRIFTPRAELPMAGHPTVGSAFALAQEGRLDPGRDSVVFGLGIGPTAVELEWNDDDQLVRAWMVQPVPEFGAPIEKQAMLAAALGIREPDLLAGAPPQIVSAGVEFLIVALASRAAVDAVRFNRAIAQEMFVRSGLAECGVFVFSPERSEGDDADAYSRMFAPVLGVPEDPATGSASGPLGAYLLRHEIASAEPDRTLVSLQGVGMGRPSRVLISVDCCGGEVRSVRVGGEAVLAGHGSLRI